eukprot:TRINITY_DN12113_c0_g1_i6.p1 TRINITY_DN12113_c0_g1~~TRINITY_DN12113_c0_g1_i6.p1  ORF type:complete len:705 (+),score=91.57 TRINITY_DN12113_c0_g1_i6:65-2116(+)
MSVAIAVILGSLCTASCIAAPKKPHIVMILADDYGHGGLGFHRKEQAALSDDPEDRQALAEIHTDNLDALISQGIKLDRHYSFKICSPSRSSLQSGRLPVHVNAVNAGPLVHNSKDPVSGYAGIPRNMTGIAAKLREGGYRTHMVGKWDAGMATPDHTPLGRGYESWLGYYQHANSYWTEGTTLESTGEFDQCLNRMRDLAFLNETYHGPLLNAASQTTACRADRESDPACYEEYTFKQRSLEVIQQHSPAEPLFLFHAFHLLHTPLQVPKTYLDRIDELVSKAFGRPFDSVNRRLYAAMVLYMDDVVGELVDALKTKDMWNSTLLIFLADNGGPLYEPGAANNHPLKGGKYNDFEGGVRSNAFVSGGFIPVDRRGSRFDGVVSIADWYGTLCEIAGVDKFDKRALAANAWLEKEGLPVLQDVDSVAQWGFILNESNGRSDALHLSDQAVLKWPYKLVVGGHPYARWAGTIFPNCSSVKDVQDDHGPTFVGPQVFDKKINIARSSAKQDQLLWWQDCGDKGCLYDISKDPSEHNDLAHDVEFESVRKELASELQRLNKNLFSPNRGDSTSKACKTALQHGRVFGPFVDADEWYTQAPAPPSIGQRAEELLYGVVGSPVVKKITESMAQTIFPFVRARGFSNQDQCIGKSNKESGVVVQRPFHESFSVSQADFSHKGRLAEVVV